MLGSIGHPPLMEQCASVPLPPDRYRRNEKEDLKIAIDYIWEFAEKLQKLHPNVVDTVEKMLGRRF